MNKELKVVDEFSTPKKTEFVINYENNDEFCTPITKNMFSLNDNQFKTSTVMRKYFFNVFIRYKWGF